MSVEIRGVVEMQKGLKKMATMDDVKQAIRVNTTEMHQKASRRVRVDSGHLKRSLTIEFSDNGLTGRVYTDVEYAGCKYVARSINNALELVKIGGNLIKTTFFRGWNMV